MKLNIDFQHDQETGRQRAVITDDRSERMPCVRNVELKYRYPRPSGEASIVTIELVVNGTDVTLGRAVEPAASAAPPAQSD